MTDEKMRELIVNEVLTMQADQRYGHFTHPVTLGMLLALDLLRDRQP